jgi:hypothetical protein
MQYDDWIGQTPEASEAEWMIFFKRVSRPSRCRRATLKTFGYIVGTVPTGVQYRLDPNRPGIRGTLT